MLARLLIIYLSLSLSFGDIRSTGKFRYPRSLLSGVRDGGMNFHSAMLMAVEHTSIPFIGACFSCRHPLIFLPSDVCSLLLPLRLFFPENSTPSSDVTGTVLTADSAQRYCDLRQYLSAGYTKKYALKSKLIEIRSSTTANLKVYCRSLVCWTHQNRIFWSVDIC